MSETIDIRIGNSKNTQIYIFKLYTHLYIRHGEYPNPPSVLAFIPVVVHLPDDVHGITLLKRQLPATHLGCQSATHAVCKEYTNNQRNTLKVRPPKRE